MFSTKVGVEWCLQKALDTPSPVRIGVVVPNMHVLRAEVIEGRTGFLAYTIGRPYEGTFFPMLRRLSFPNKSQINFYRGTDPDELRGPQFHYVWLGGTSEYAYSYSQVFGNAMSCLRLGDQTNYEDNVLITR